MSHISLTAKWVTCPASGHRNEWRKQTVERLFAGHLARLFHSLSKAAPIPMPILWENAAVRVYSLYEKRIGQGAGRDEAFRIRDDFEYLISTAPAGLFGEAGNPLAKFYGTASAAAASNSPASSARIRKTCLYYRVRRMEVIVMHIRKRNIVPDCESMRSGKRVSRLYRTDLFGHMNN
ncbi:ferric iron reductase [Paenibacillus hemerocallicola]|uniref:ferric iron reductase n=1 Tax=Paenibacillus hemerocallicola TaxID=1172614 RepID=UPI00159EC16E|nr:ferric iron reductase [Paenibacillus hemerocallicola]